MVRPNLRRSSMISFSRFDQFDFRVGQGGTLTWQNASPTPIPLAFPGRQGDVHFAAESNVAEGTPISMGAPASKARSLRREELNELDLRVALVIEQKNHDDCFLLTLHFGDRQVDVVFPDPERSLSLKDRTILTIVNLRPECIHDSPIAILAYRRNNLNVPFFPKGEVAAGAKLVRA
jgi:hypothetical protein